MQIATNKTELEKLVLETKTKFSEQLAEEERNRETGIENLENNLSSQETSQSDSLESKAMELKNHFSDEITKLSANFGKQITT